VADSKYRLTVEELQLFVTQLETLPARVTGCEAVTQLLEQVEKFQTSSQKFLCSSGDDHDIDELTKVIEFGSGKIGICGGSFKFKLLGGQNLRMVWGRATHINIKLFQVLTLIYPN
jgi:hypothetical protein